MLLPALRSLWKSDAILAVVPVMEWPGHHVDRTVRRADRPSSFERAPSPLTFIRVRYELAY